MRRFIIFFSMFASLLGAQTTITLRGTTYNLNDHPRTFFDGPSGSIVTGIKDPDGTGKLLAPKAVSSNVPWTSLLNRSAFWFGFAPYTDLNFAPDQIGGQQAAAYAMRWYSDNSQAQYHDAALYMLNHIEKYYPTFCDENMGECIWAGGSGYYVTSYGLIYWNMNWLFAYELMRGEMTAQQRTDFASKFLNDLSTAGGISGSPGTSCTNPSANATGTVSVAGPVITSTAALFGPGNPIQVGYWVVENSANGSAAIAQIVSITDANHATFSSRVASSWNGFSGTLGYRRNTWQNSDCGIMWVGKHGGFVTQVLAYLSGATAYPPAGGTRADYASNNTYAQYGQNIAVFLALMDDDANASVRSQRQLTNLYDDWYTNIFSTYVEHGFTGFHYTGSAYGTSRPFDMFQIPAEFTFSINGTPPPVAGGVWAKNALYHYTHNWVPGCAAGEPQWGQDFGLSNTFSDPNNLYHAMMPYALYRNTPEGQWFNWTLRHRMSACGNYGNTPGQNLYWTTTAISGSSNQVLDQWLYALTDPAWPSSDLSVSGPNAVALNQVDASSAKYPQSALISRTGFKSVTDTLINFYGLAEQKLDHNYPSGGFYPGAYKIFKGNYLLAADGDQYTAPNSPYSGDYVSYHGGGSNSDYMEIGGPTNLQNSNHACGATMPRTDIDGTTNRFAYAMVDSTACYSAGVARAQRHLVDLKGGSQQFVVVYDDVVSTTGQTKRTFLHYPNNFGASTDVTRGSTLINGNTIVSSNPGTGHGDATQLLTTVLAPGNNQVLVYTDNPNGTYTGGNGKTFRVSACASSNGTTCDASNKAAEFLVVHEPVGGAANTLPPVGIITTDLNWRGVQVSGSAPKVVLFARNGAFYLTASFVSTHSGVAQILVAGLQPGTYNVAGPTATSGTVGADGVLYFEGTSGSYVISPAITRKFTVQGVATISGQSAVR